jgi:hypothetical protein
MTMSVRINARLDEALARRIEQLRAEGGQSLTKVIEEALEAWADRREAVRTSPADIFRARGFIGAGVGPANLSENVKSALSRSLRKKQ